LKTIEVQNGAVEQLGDDLIAKEQRETEAQSELGETVHELTHANHKLNARNEELMNEIEKMKKSHQTVDKTAY
jgi:septation ring formation regulator EzrA